MVRWGGHKAWDHAVNDWQLQAVFYKAAYQQFVTEASAHLLTVAIASAGGKWNCSSVGSTGLKGHVCVNSPLSDWLPGSWAQPPAHTESKRGPRGSTAVDARGNEKCLVRKLYSVNPLALYLSLLISHNILIKSRWWETIWEEMKKRRPNGGWCFLSPCRKFPNWTCFRRRKERGEVKGGISKETPVLKSSNPFITYSKYAMLCSVIPEFCSSPLGHQLWFSTVNKHDVVLIAIAQTGIIFFLSTFSTYLLRFASLQMRRANEKHSTVHITASLLELSKRDTELFLWQDYFREFCVLIKIRQRRVVVFLKYSNSEQIQLAYSGHECVVIHLKLKTWTESKENVRKTAVKLMFNMTYHTESNQSCLSLSLCF